MNFPAENSMVNALRYRFAQILAAGLLVLVSMTASGRADELKAGVAVVDITPPAGYRMSGYFQERFNTGTHDPLQARVLVLRQGDEHLALVVCDLIGIAREVSDAARQETSRRTGIAPEQIVITATHSHTGPLYFGALRAYFHERALAQQGEDPAEKVDYPAQLVQKIAVAVEQAQSQLQPVRLKSGVAEETGLAFNRRFHMKDGSVRFNPGKLNPDIIRPAGPIDPDVSILLIETGEGQPLTALTSFALHLDTVGGTLYSADYPYYLEQILRKTLGERFVSIFATGTCGDINHIDVTNDRPQKGQEEAARIGRALGQKVLEQLPKLQAVERSSLDSRSRKLNLPLQQYSPERTQQAQADLAKIGTRELSFLEQVEAYKIAALALHESPTLPAEVQVFRIGEDVAVVTLPGEVFVELGLAIKRQSPFKQTFVLELAQDAPGYVPTKKAFAEGSYETVNSRVMPGGGEAMVDAALEMLHELKSTP